MQYKTITLELLQHEYPALHERLRASRTLLQALDRYATGLKALHEQWMTEYTQANPHLDAVRISSIALEEAIEDLREGLRSDSPASPPDDASFSLDAAMAYLRRHTPPA